MGKSRSIFRRLFLFTEQINDHFLIHQKKHFFRSIILSCSFLILDGTELPLDHATKLFVPKALPDLFK